MRNLFTVLFAIVSFYSPLSLAQQCDQRGVINSDADVYENPPRYVTGIGWQGVQRGRLSPGTQVYVCRELSVAFGLSEKTWSQIAYRAGNAWKYGWILKNSWGAWKTMNERPENTYVGRYILFASAFAVEPPASSADGSDWKLSVVPPPAPAPIAKGASSFEETASPVAWTDLAKLYAPFFVAMLIGMLAKAVVDLVDQWDRHVLWVHLRNGVTAAMVSPIVFLGFINAGQFPGAKQTFLVLLLLAFQNGFFWQAVLKKDNQRAQANAPAKLGSA